MKNEIQTGDIVKGKVCGTFAVLGFRTIGGDRYAQLKPVCSQTQKMLSGELALPIDAIQKV